MTSQSPFFPVRSSLFMRETLPQHCMSPRQRIRALVRRPSTRHGPQSIQIFDQIGVAHALQMHSEKEQCFFIKQALSLQGELRQLLQRYTGKKSDTDDLLQDTYLRLLRSAPPSGSNQNSVRAFCKTTARHLALDWLKDRKRVLTILSTMRICRKLPMSTRTLNRSSMKPRNSSRRCPL